MNKMPIKYNPLVNNVLRLGQRTGHCPAGIFKNIISNVTKNEEAGHGLVHCPVFHNRVGIITITTRRF